MTATSSSSIDRLMARYDPGLFAPSGRPTARIRLIGDGEPVDVVLEAQRGFVVTAAGRPDAELSADPQTWLRIAEDLRGGLEAFREGRLRIRRDLHLGVGFLAATAGDSDAGLRFAQVATAVGPLSINEAGSGDPVILLHGLGATKVSLLPTLAALAPERRAIAVDLPGFGDSVKPLRAAYDAPFFADAVIALMDALELERADLVGNSLGGRIALEVALRAPERAGRLGLLAPSLPWLRPRPWAPLLRLVRPQLGLIQPAPRPLVEMIVRHVVPGAHTEWTAAGIDEFLRSYLTPRGRSAFYAAARQIYLEQPHGPAGLWTRLPDLRAPALFVWGQQDHLVPVGFSPHVQRALSTAEHLVIDCGHVPQLEAPAETHRELLRFLTA